ncbi:Mov34/MPN/PAD-1 family protein [Halobacterium zhouii]|uniref:Mov34/MPN/PAD-1 family protein n=1 Tax=Halobacterium zhouii TaxID=2902624 RepID=UPI001E2E4EA1|nr:Mov34/MPN/PAD-1 family protein [Halobacterium zhouii]
MVFGGKPSVLGIAAEALEFATEAAEDTHPNEYLGLLRATPASDLGVAERGYVITDVLVVPGTETNPVSATFGSSQVPNDMRTVGSIHSHPNGVLAPSDADRAMFGKGEVHVILGAPYGPDRWRAFDHEGEPRSLDVLDVELPDDEAFFDFTQEDIDEELE